MSFPNLSDLYLERLVLSVIDEDEEENTGVPGNATDAGDVWNTVTLANTGVKASPGASKKHTIINLVRLPGDVMNSNGVAFLFFKALRANLHRNKLGYYDAHDELAKYVPEPVKNEFGLWDTGYVLETENGEYTSHVWRAYLEKQNEILDVLRQRYIKNLNEDTINTGHLFQPPYLHVNSSYINFEDNATNFTRATQIMLHNPEFTLHKGAFNIKDPSTSTRCEHSESIKSFWEGLICTTYALMRELEQETRLEIYNKLVDYLACEIDHGTPKKMFNQDNQELDDKEKKLARLLYVKSTFNMIDQWETSIMNYRRIMGLTMENKSWDKYTSLGLTELQLSDAVFIYSWANQRSNQFIQKQGERFFGFNKTHMAKVSLESF
jgi:hypothetical protein